ncbi:MAG: glycoside hydrolase family 108 protein [Oceanicaulis sp.]
MADFDRALEVVLRWEGGFVDHPDDPGGATNLGITLATLSAWRGAEVTAEDVRALTHAEARDIYRDRYWAAASCAAFDPGVAVMVFDAAVNHGPRQAALFLQRAAGVRADGDIGPITRAAVDAADPAALCEEIAARRMAFYGALSTFDTFGLGWSRRLMNVLRHALSAVEPG